MEAINTSIVSVDRVLGMQEEINSLNNQVSSLQRELGSEEEHNQTLRNQIEELKSKQPEVRIITSKPVSNRYGDTYTESTIEYRNLSSVQDDIRKEIEAKYKKDLDKSEATIKSLNKDLESKQDFYHNEIKKIESRYENYSLGNRLSFEADKRALDEREIKKDLKIKELKEEIEKIKNDKTDEQLAKQREEEIKTLKDRIEELEASVANLTSTNIFKRIWNAILDKNARVAAQKELLKKKEKADKITYGGNNYWTNCYYKIFGF